MRIRAYFGGFELRPGPPAPETAAFPQIEGIRIPGGFRQRRAPESRLALVIAGIFLAGAVMDFVSDVREYQAQIAALTFWAVFSAFVFYQQLTGFNLLRWKARQFAGAFLDVRPWPLRLGEQFEIEFVLKRRALAGTDRAGARIECTERCDKQDSNGDVVEIRRVILLDDIALNPTRRQRLRCTTQIPRDEPASIVLPTASIEWRLVITTLDEVGRSMPQYFPLLVLPQVPK
jgi:hypothetical protein